MSSLCLVRLSTAANLSLAVDREKFGKSNIDLIRLFLPAFLSKSITGRKDLTYPNFMVQTYRYLLRFHLSYL